MVRLFADDGMPGGPVRFTAPVYFSRHGQTDWNAQQRFQGHSDIPLNDVGRAQAARNGLALARELAAARIAPERLACFASPLVRARETMEIIRQGLRLSARRFAIDDRLIEIDLGVWNGKTPEEIEAETPGAFAEREKDKWGYIVPGGESYKAASARTREFLLELRKHGRRQPVLVVGHGASGRLLRGYLSGMNRDDVPHLKAPQTVLFKLHRGRETEI